MEAKLYTYLILNIFIGYCVMQDDAGEGGGDEVAAAGDGDNAAAAQEGKQDSNEFKRYIIEDNYRNPIFGSYKYDPLKQQFETPADSEENLENKDGISTLAGTEESTTTPAGEGEGPPAEETTPAPGGDATDAPTPSEAAPEAKKLRDRLNAMRGGNVGKLPISHWWARARPLPTDIKSSNSTNGNSI